MWGCPLAGLRAHSRPEKGRSSNKTTKVRRAAGSVTERDVVMDYEKMKALMEASREPSSVLRKTQVQEFPKPESTPDWKYLDSVRKEQIAA